MILRSRNDLNVLRGSPLEFQGSDLPNDGCFDNKIKMIIPDVSRFNNGNIN